MKGGGGNANLYLNLNIKVLVKHGHKKRLWTWTNGLREYGCLKPGEGFYKNDETGCVQ